MPPAPCSKYTQPVKEDIGDGSVFAFMRLPPEQQEELLARLRQQGGGEDL